MKIAQQFPERKWLMQSGVIALIALLCRLLAWPLIVNSWADNGIPISDARALDIWALNILDGLGFKDMGGFWLYEAFRMPFFSVFVAALYAIFGYAYWPVRLILLGLSVATCLGIVGIGRLLFNRTVGFVAGLCYALYYPMIAYAIAYMTETLFTFLLVIGMYLFLRALHERGWGWAAWSGVAFGLAGMTRFTVFVTTPVIGLYLLLYPGSSWSRKVRLGSIWLIVMGLSFSPWVIRNAVVFHAFFPSESGGTRQMWTSANPKYEGVHYTREGRREILWADPNASEIERNQRLQKETREFIQANPIWYLWSMTWRAGSYLNIPTWSLALASPDPYQRWEHLSTWIAAWVGTIGMVLALGKRPRSGMLMAGIFVMWIGVHALAGELTRYRLTSEWLWCLSVAYVIGNVRQLASRSLLAVDQENESGITRSMFDRRFFRWGVPIVLSLPFLVLAVKIPINRARLASQTLPDLPHPAEAMIADAGLTERFARQDNTLHDVLYYIQLAKAQKAPDIKYPRHVFMYPGELSHFIVRNDNTLKSFTFRINKAGLHIGDLSTFCDVHENVELFLPYPMKRTIGIVVGHISGTGGGAGEPACTASDIYFQQNGQWISARHTES